MSTQTRHICVFERMLMHACTCVCTRQLCMTSRFRPIGCTQFPWQRLPEREVETMMVGEGAEEKRGRDDECEQSEQKLMSVCLYVY